MVRVDTNPNPNLKTAFFLKKDRPRPRPPAPAPAPTPRFTDTLLCVIYVMNQVLVKFRKLCKWFVDYPRLKLPGT